MHLNLINHIHAQQRKDARIKQQYLHARTAKC